MAHRLDGTYTVHEHKLTVETSPCCWMHPNYGIQVQYRAEDGRSWGYAHAPNEPEAKATKEFVQELLEARLKPNKCETCQTPHLFDKNGNRGKQCEKCFMKGVTAAYHKALAKENAKIAKREAKLKKDGFTHRVTAWIHPEHGDDRQVDFYTKGEPTTNEIQAELKKAKSQVLTDYTVTAL